MMTVSYVGDIRLVVFKCDRCINSRIPCVSCQQDQSVYNLGYNDAIQSTEKNFVGFNSNQVQIYLQGYTHGQADLIK